jgi:hypothetical protein
MEAVKSVEEIRKQKVFEKANEIIQKESELINNRKYSNLELDGEKLPDLPLNIMQYFKKSIISTPRNMIGATEKNPSPLKMHPLLHISKIDVKDLVFGHIEVILNVLASAMIEKWGVDDYDAMEDSIIIELVSEKYAALFNKINKELEDKFNSIISEYDNKTWLKISKSEFHK